MSHVGWACYHCGREWQPGGEFEFPSRVDEVGRFVYTGKGYWRCRECSARCADIVHGDGCRGECHDECPWVVG